jgi:hypothetical protein
MKYPRIIGLFLGCGESLAVAAPLSRCFNSGSGVGFVCDLFEEDASGNPSEIGWVITLPSFGNPTNSPSNSRRCQRHDRYTRAQQPGTARRVLGIGRVASQR